MRHILLTCPQCAAEWEILGDPDRNSGGPCASLHDLIFPTGPPRTIRFVFGAAAQYLPKSSVNMEHEHGHEHEHDRNIINR